VVLGIAVSVQIAKSVFLDSWVTHFIIVFLVMMGSYVLIKITEKFFFGYQSDEEGLDAEHAVIYISLTIIVVCVYLVFSKI
jgi:Kef-type K+ transport system membrane component KefB